MKKFLVYILALGASAVLSYGKVNIVATLPDFGSIAEIIGGEKVKVTTIAKGTEDAHFVDARPSFVRVLNQADILIEGGAELEIGWLPPLVNGARNSKILGDAPGHLVLGRYIQLLDMPRGPVDRSMGDVHPAGNPHFWLDPENGKIIAEKIAETLGQVDPKNAATYNANLKKFIGELDQRMAKWSKEMEPFRGVKVITYHKSYDYFAKRFGLVIVGQLEPRPGFEPTPVHISALIPKAKQEGVKLILIEPFRPRKTPEYVANAIGAELLVLPEKVGGNESVKTYFDLFDYDTEQIAKALKGKP